MKIVHSRIQHGVGQGSFHSGSLTVERDSTASCRFDYVYDCGALAVGRQTKELKRSCKRLALTTRKADSKLPFLDLLVLSHFDQDHINGAQDLVANVEVGRIVIPHVGPNELAFVIAALAAEIKSDLVSALHNLVHGGGKLWGAPVTMVAKGPREADLDRPPERKPEDPSAKKDNAATDCSMPITVSSTGGPLTETIADTENCLVSTVSSEAWYLRFWNRGLDEELMELVLDELRNCGFPVKALDDSINGAAELTGWISKTKNRDLAVAAYRHAIQARNPNWLPEISSLGLSNHLSLGMYSGPGKDASKMVERYDRLDRIGHSKHCVCCVVFECQHQNTRPGWLGTGDAPLGEIDVWNDFYSHFNRELPEVGTVLIPHHGAAPNGGPRYYNPGLNHPTGRINVISFGESNSYGHPKTSVLTEILAAGGEVQLVTEKSLLGFHEVLTI